MITYCGILLYFTYINLSEETGTKESRNYRSDYPFTHKGQQIVVLILAMYSIVMISTKMVWFLPFPVNHAHSVLESGDGEARFKSLDVVRC